MLLFPSICFEDIIHNHPTIYGLCPALLKSVCIEKGGGHTLTSVIST
jgi:hypothetical protein